MELVQEMFVSSFRRVFFLFFWGGGRFMFGEKHGVFLFGEKGGWMEYMCLCSSSGKNGFDSGIGGNFLK